MQSKKQEEEEPSLVQPLISVPFAVEYAQNAHATKHLFRVSVQGVKKIAFWIPFQIPTTYGDLIKNEPDSYIVGENNEVLIPFIAAANLQGRFDLKLYYSDASRLTEPVTPKNFSVLDFVNISLVFGDSAPKKIEDAFSSLVNTVTASVESAVHKYFQQERQKMVEMGQELIKLIQKQSIEMRELREKNENEMNRLMEKQEIERMELREDHRIEMEALEGMHMETAKQMVKSWENQAEVDRFGDINGNYGNDSEC